MSIRPDVALRLAAICLFSCTPTFLRADPPAPVVRSSKAPAAVSQATVAIAKKVPVIDRRSTRGEALARTALAYRGAPYRFGGRSASTGFDCSGLVQTVCAKWGIYVPRAAHAQYSAGKPVKPDDLQPGDLVFFKNTYKRGLSHVGVYIGNRKFLHAAGHRFGVMVSKLDDTYHRNHYVGARRLNLSHLPPVPGEEGVPQRVVLDDGKGEPMPITSQTVPADILGVPVK